MQAKGVDEDYILSQEIAQHKTIISELRKCLTVIEEAYGEANDDIKDRAA
jgi:hypothetical protein